MESVSTKSGSDLVRLDRLESGIVVLSLNDPDTRNAMSEAMAEQFSSIVTELSNDRLLRVVVLTGVGAAFSGGGHLDMLFEKTKLSEDENRLRMEQFYKRFLSVRQIPVPVIAAINGHAVGAGLCLALGCDIRIAVPSAKLGLNFVNLGLHPGMGATYFLPRLIGPAKAAELLYCGSIITAEKALALGMVSQLVEPEKLSSCVEQLAKSIAEAGPQAIRELKVSLQLSEQSSLEASLKREALCQAQDYHGLEFLEGISAAKERRKPKF